MSRLGRWQRSSPICGLMARRSLEISRTAEKQLRALPVDAQRRLAHAMLALPRL